MAVVGRQKGLETLDEATLIALTGISGRSLIRWRQQGLVLAEEPRRGLGPPRGSTALRYSQVEVFKINRIKELKRKFKKVFEWRWHLWHEDHRVRIAPDLAKKLDQFRTLAVKIKTLDDIETIISATICKHTDVPRGNPLREILRDLSRNELRSLATMVICVVLGIRLPLFDEPNPYPFQIFKRAFGLPKEWEMPPGLFDVFPYMHEKIRNALLKASTDEQEVAKAASRFLSHILDNPESWRCGAIVISGAQLQWRLIKFASLIWRLPVVRAATVGLIILAARSFKSTFGKEAAAAFASIAREATILWPESR
jgi:hypothetical protein